MIEEWRTVPIEGCEHYEVSNFGNVKLLPREVPTRVVNRGRDMIVTAKRKGKDIKPSFDGGRPVVRMTTINGTRVKKSLPLLVLMTFNSEGCPGDVDKYTAAYLDGDASNNRLDNLTWVSKVALMQSVSTSTKGEAHEYLQKYNYVLIKIHDKVVGYFENTTEGAELFNSYGFTTSASALGRALLNKNQFYFTFDLVPVSKFDYIQVSMKYPQINLKMLYDIVMEERRHVRKDIKEPKESKPKVIVEKKIVEKVVEKIKIEKEIVEKIVYVDRATGQKTRKPYAKKVESPKEHKQDVETKQEILIKKETPKVVAKAKIQSKAKTRLDDLTDEDFIRDMQQARRDKFKDELLRRLG